MKRIIVVVFILMLSPVVFAQSNMSVTEFRLSTEQTANLAGNIVRDDDGKPCALIRVQTTQKGFKWEFGQFRAFKVEESHTAEIWVYVPYGVKRCKIFHDQLGTCEYWFPIPIESAKTYIMDLSAANVVTTIVHQVTTQFVVFKLFPKDSNIELDGELLPVNDGIAEKLVKFGNHKYIVYRNNYHKIEGEVTVDNPDNKKTMELELKPAFGLLRRINPQKEESIFVDDRIVDFSEHGEIRLSSGIHRIKIAAPRYVSYSGTVNIVDGQTFDIDVKLVPNFTGITFQTSKGTEIWINGEKKGVGTWTGEANLGMCRIELKKPSHKTIVVEKEITPKMSGTTMSLPSPEPIFGTLVIVSNPTESEVVLDGEAIGKTPLQLSKIIIGNHTIKIVRDGYLTKTQNFVIEENKGQEMHFELQKGKMKAHVSVKQTGQGVFSLYENGKSFFTGNSFSGLLEEGNYYALSKLAGCDDGRVDFSVVGDTPVAVVVPEPKRRYGNIFLKTNSKKGKVMWRLHGNSTSFDEANSFEVGKQWEKHDLCEGRYDFKASSSGRYYDSDVRTASISKDKDLKMEFKMKKYHWISEKQHECKAFLDVLYGYSFPRVPDADFSVSNHQVGLNFSYIDSHVGFNMSILKGLRTLSDFSFAIGPLLRFTDDTNDMDVQLYVGGGFEMDKNYRFTPMLDTGLRLGFDNIGTYRAWSWWSLYSGCQISSKNIVPVAGVSLFPFSLFAQDWMWTEQPSFASSFLDMLFGYGSEGFRCGLRYSFINCQMGGHLSCTYGGAGLGITAGPVFRLTTDWRNCDLQLFGGAGICTHGRTTPAGDLGIRFAWRCDRGFSLWDFGLDCMINERGVTPILSMSVVIPFLIGTCGLGAFAIF